MRKRKLLETKAEKLLGVLEEMNDGARGANSDKLICETEITMARIRAYSDFMYLLKKRPLQTACYYGAVFFLLTLIAALWTREWLLSAIFAVVTGILATLPHNMKIHYFNKDADGLEGYYGKNLNVEFADDALVIREAPPALNREKAAERAEFSGTETEQAPENSDTADSSDEASPRAKAPTEFTKLAEIPYNALTAVECSHSFYLFPQKSETVICDKTLFLRGTPMGARDFLARKLGRKLKIKTRIK